MKRQAHGRGIYSTPNVDVACLYGAPATFRENEETKQVVLQVKLNPSGTRIVQDQTWGTYYVTENPEDVRLYGVLVRKMLGK